MTDQAPELLPCRETLLELANSDPARFELEHPKIASAAYKFAEEHYKAMCLWRRSDLRSICNENWPAFVEDVLK